MEIKKWVVRFAKVLLFSHVYWHAIQDIAYNRLRKETTFNIKYSELQKNLAPYVWIPWPSLYNNTDELILLWVIIKMFVALMLLVPKSGLNWVMKDIVLIECLS